VTGSIATIWPMFGVANQLLAMIALCVGTTMILRSATRPSYALVTLVPLCFVGTTTTTAGIKAIVELYWPMSRVAATAQVGWVNLVVTTTLLACVLAVLIGSVRRWYVLLAFPQERTPRPAAGAA
jgi:carbon starvation protein